MEKKEETIRYKATCIIRCLSNMAARWINMSCDVSMYIYIYLDVSCNHLIHTSTCIQNKKNVTAWLYSCILLFLCLNRVIYCMYVYV